MTWTPASPRQSRAEDHVAAATAARLRWEGPNPAVGRDMSAMIGARIRAGFVPDRAHSFRFTAAGRKGAHVQAEAGPVPISAHKIRDDCLFGPRTAADRDYAPVHTLSAGRLQGGTKRAFGAPSGHDCGAGQPEEPWRICDGAISQGLWGIGFALAREASRNRVYT